MPEQRLKQIQLIFDTMPNSAWMKDRSGTYLVINKRFEKYGILKGIQIIGKTDFEVFPAHMARQYRAVDEAVMQSGKPRIADQLYENKTGSIWYDTYVAPVAGNNGEITGTIGFARRITRRKQLELELNQQKEFLKTMIDTIPDFIFYKDVNSMLLGCNKACLEQLYGVTETEAIGKTILDILQDEDFAQKCLMDDWEALATGRIVKSEEGLPLVSGAILEVETIKSPFFDKTGKVAGLIGISRDISARKRLERQLKESHERYAAIVNNAPEVVMILQAGIIKFINDVGIAVMGYDRREIIGSHICRHFTPESVRQNAAILADMTRPKEVNTYDVEFITKAGEIKNGLSKTAPITINSQQADLVVLIDVTEKKKIEAKLRESEAKFRQLAENINEVFMIRDDKRFLYISPAYEKITGQSGQACLINPRAILDIIYPPDREKVWSGFIQSGQQLAAEDSGEFRFFRADGRLGWAWVRTYSLPSGAGNNRQQAITLVDITERKLMEEQLRHKDAQTQRELTLAARVQRDTLPKPFCSAKVRVNTMFLPYHTVSGDLVNFEWFEQEQKLRGYIVDVSGHGMATALQTATVKILLDQRLLSGREIGEDDFQYINRRMMQYLYEESFAGLMYFDFDFTAYQLTVITGGIHFFLAAKRQECVLVPVFSGYLGMFEQAEIQTITVPFKPGETYCLMSDGVSDLIELYGPEHFTGLSQCTAWLERLWQCPERSDDFSAVCVEILEAKRGIEFVIKTQGELATAQLMIAEFLERNVPDDAVMLEVAVNEAVNNGLRAGEQVTVRLKRLGQRLIIRVKDQGPGFSPALRDILLKREVADEELAAAFDRLGLAECGRGLLMMKMLCDRLVYNAKGNEVLLLKKFSQSH